MPKYRECSAVAADFDPAAANRSMITVRPGIVMLNVSAKSGQGMAEYLEFLETRRES